ncbi:amino acid kinase family protein [Streptomyces violascens]|uniref:amino acid kinase family protein n=1 Tax=Streptomyces violascens TaxID=67381 RepID=UPI0036586658
MSGPDQNPKAGEPRTLVVKVGGSLVSDKRTDDHLDHDAVRDYARLIADLVDTHPGRVVFVAGGGALGHGAIRDLHDFDGFAQLALTNATFAVKWAWTRALRSFGIRAVPLQVMAMCADGADGPVADLTVVRRTLAEGALPVLSGDCILTSGSRLRVLGSDHVPGILVDDALGPVRIVTLTDVPGIRTGAAPDGPVLEYVDPFDPSAAYTHLWETAAWDTSGAMRGKVDALTGHARRGAECLIMRGERTAPGLRHLFWPMADWPESLERTLIARRTATIPAH